MRERRIYSKYCSLDATGEILDPTQQLMLHSLTTDRNFSQVVSDGQFAALGLVLIAAVAKIDALFTMPRNSVKQLNSDEARSTEIDVETEMGPLEDQGRSVPRSMQSLHVELEPGKEQQPPTTAISWLEGTDAQARSYGRIHRSANGLGVGYLSSNKLKTSKRKKGNGCNIIDELFSSVDRGSRQYK